MTKIFKHIFDSKYQFPKLAETKMNGMRFYRVDGKLFPSVTTILSIQPKEGLEEWRNSVGHEAAAWEMRRAATRGTKFHMRKWKRHMTLLQSIVLILNHVTRELERNQSFKQFERR